MATDQKTILEQKTMRITQTKTRVPSPPGMLRDVVPPVAVVFVLASLLRIWGSSEAELEVAAGNSDDGRWLKTYADDTDTDEGT